MPDTAVTRPRRKRDRATGARARAAAATRAKILIAAERLFAEKGIEAVSLREIAGEARQANSNAVQYHFSTKDNLVSKVFEFRAAQLEPLRMAMLATAERENRLGDMRTLLQLLYLPYLTVIDEEGRHHYAGFIAKYVMGARLAGVPYPFDEPEPQAPALRRIRSLIEQRLNFLPPEMIRPRIQTATQSFASMLLRFDSGVKSGLSAIPLWTLVMDTIEQVTSGICAPYAFDRSYLFEGDIPQSSVGGVGEISSPKLQRFAASAAT